MLENLLLYPESASTIAPRIDAIFWYITGISVFFALGIALAIIWFSWNYHHDRAVDRSNPPDSNLSIEMVWIGVPFLLVMSIFLWGAKIFVDAREAPANSREMYVVGKQWMWKIQHPEGPREINALHVPVGQPVKLLMISQDVIHSFFIPEFRIKQDVIPGAYTSQWFQATKAGHYHLYCAQYCGADHSLMIGEVVVMTPPDFADWLRSPNAQPSSEGSGASSMAQAGEQVVQRLACLTCHKPEGKGTAPSFVKLYGSKVEFNNGETTIADEAYLRDCILKPNRRVLKGYQPAMPSFQGQINEDELMQLIAYIKSQSSGAKP